jgi:hypothetical protein
MRMAEKKRTAEEIVANLKRATSHSYSVQKKNYSWLRLCAVRHATGRPNQGYRHV